MNNIINYAETQLETFIQREFNAVDSLILSQLSYINFDKLVGTINTNYSETSITIRDLLKAEYFPYIFKDIINADSTKKLLFFLAANPRFRDIEIRYFHAKLDLKSEEQFAAITFILNNIDAYICFRGTDFSIIGWKEDFNMSFMTPVPSQLEGINYVNTIAKLIPQNIYIGGHSKGGNIAVYSALKSNKRLQNRIRKIFSHDGPGFTKEIIDSLEFHKIESKINKTLPSSALIGMLLENHEEYYVVKSNKPTGLLQHDPFSWEISNNDFYYIDKMTYGANYLNNTIKEWLNNTSAEKRKIFIDALFSIFNSTKHDNFLDISENWKDNIPIILSSFKDMDEDIKTIIIELLKDFTSISLKNLVSKKLN